MKLRYMPLIFTLILGLLNALVSEGQAQARLYQEIPRPKNLAPVYSLAFASSTDKPTYLLGQMNHFLLTTDTQEHHKIRHPRYYIGSRTVCAAFSRALKYALVLSKGNLVLLYDALDDESWSSFSTDFTVNAVAFSPDSKIIAVGTAENVSFWDVQTKGKHLRQPKSPDTTQALAFSPDGKILAIGKMLGTVELWDVNKNTNLTVLQPKVPSSHGIYALAFSPDGKTLAAGKAHNGEIDLWTVPRGKSLGLLKGHQTTATIHSVAFSPNNRTLASGATDGSVLFWDVQTQKKIDPIQHFTQKHPEFSGTGHGEKTEVLSVAFSDDGKTLMSGDATGLVLLWDLSKIDTETEHDMTPPTIALGPIPTVTAEARRVTLRGSTTSSIGIQENRIRITNNGKTQPSTILTANGKFAVSIPLNEGNNQIIFTVVDKNEQSAQNRVTLHRPLTPPEIEVIQPRLGVNNAADIAQPTQQIRVRITDTSAIARVTLNDREMAPTLTKNVYALTSPPIVAQATFTLSAIDTHGSQNSEVFTLTYRQPDDTPPTLTIIQPVLDASNAATLNTSPFPVTVEVRDESGIQDVRINGIKADALGENRFSRSISQSDSLNRVEIKATDTVGNTRNTSFRVVYQKPLPDPDVSPTLVERNDPRLLFADSKLEDTRRKTSNQAVFTLEFIVLDESRIKEVTAKRSDDSTTYPVSKSGKRDYTTHLQLKEGENRFEIQVTDEWNNIELETVTIIRVSVDTEPPRFTVLDPIPAVNAQTRQVTVRGGVTSSIGIQGNRIRITNNGKTQPSATLTASGRFTASIPLNEGDNQIIFTAVDKNKQSAQNRVTLHRPLTPPEIEVLQPRLDANSSAEVRESIQRIRVRVTDASEITQITLNGTEMEPTVKKDVYVLTSKPIVSQATFTVSAVDTHGSQNSKSFTLTYRQPDDTPPTLTIIQPVLDASNTATIAPLPFLVTVEVRDESGIQDVRINGVKADALGNDTFNGTVLYNASLSQVEIKATDTAGNTNTKSFRVVHQKPLPEPDPTLPTEREDPRLLFTDSKLEDTRRKTSNQAVFTLEFIVLDESRIEEVTVKRNDDSTVYPVSKSGKRDYTAHLQLKVGDNRFEIRVADEWDNIEIETITLTRIQADTKAPRFTSLSVGEGIQVQQILVRGGHLTKPIVVANERLVLRGRLTDESGIATVKVAVNDRPPEGLLLQDGTRFEKRLSLDYGQNQIHLTATDIRGNSDDTRFTIHQRPDRDGKDLALFFATDRYEGKKDTHGHWRDLTTAIADAEQVAKKLRDVYGFKTKVIKNPTKRTLMETLITYQDRFIDENGTEFRYEDGAQLLIYFAGHGYYNKKTAAGYLVTQESEPPSIDPAQVTAVEHSSIRRSIDLIACNRMLVLMDTCFSGTFDPKYKPQISAQLRSLVEDGTLLDQINMMLKLTARWCLTSASSEYVADTGGTNGHSPFAAAFMAALDTRGGADTLLKLDEIWDKIQDSKHADIYNELEQNPQRAGLKTFERPEPRKGQFGAKAELYEESDFLLFPTMVNP